ncbi:hypothetical protein P280DRAFT_519114 [Massarina eburnea CBS 473.64]|uniref:C2H2-type domain-containing protein n=1 Tax=Massarina eburnea CBS 473.64 TaxID=1395130 RepID=A0A6A6RY71_9PLEO|nr:hypothetical protein P280DRAFT_519114 [Massarina eburnea CBS 473.64]
MVHGFRNTTDDRDQNIVGFENSRTERRSDAEQQLSWGSAIGQGFDGHAFSIARTQIFEDTTAFEDPQGEHANEIRDGFSTYTPALPYPGCMPLAFSGGPAAPESMQPHATGGMQTITPFGDWPQENFGFSGDPAFLTGMQAGINSETQPTTSLPQNDFGLANGSYFFGNMETNIHNESQIPVVAFPQDGTASSDRGSVLNTTGPLTRPKDESSSKVTRGNVKKTRCEEPGCKATFGRPQEFRRHFRTVHERKNDSGYRCILQSCNYEYPRLDKVRSHMAKKHGMKVEKIGKAAYDGEEDE